MLSQLLLFVTFALMLVAGPAGNGCNDAAKGHCSHHAVVIDMSDLDGCTIFFRLDDGRKLLPLQDSTLLLPALHDGDEVRIDFIELRDQMSICMAEDAMVRITCLEVLELTADDCTKWNDPFDSEWSKTVMMQADPVRVEIHEVTGGPYVHYITMDRNRRIYSCLGKHLCTVTDQSNDNCNMYFGEVEDIKVLYVVDR